jgi:protein-L-isoaspartate(D-aspartate) O-methyltransferase
VSSTPTPKDPEAQMRARMVETQIAARGVRDPRVLDAMRTVPRHLFVGTGLREKAYEDHPLPIPGNQTISQPYIVALMTELLELQPSDRVLEIGTGSGYQSAVLSKLCREVYSIEIVPELAERARATLAELGVPNVEVFAGDGFRGLPDRAPFDGILLTAAPSEVPQPLLDQLAMGGRLVAPVGGFDQDLRVLERTPEGIRTTRLFPVRFVPFVRGGEDAAPRPVPTPREAP